MDIATTIIISCFYSFACSVLFSLGCVYLFLGKEPLHSRIFLTRAKMIVIFACIILLKQIVQQVAVVVAHYDEESFFARLNFFLAITNDSSDLILVALVLFYASYHILILKYGNHPERDIRVRIVRAMYIICAILLVTFLVVFVSMHMIVILLAGNQGMQTETYAAATKAGKISLETLFAGCICLVLAIMSVALSFWKPIPEYYVHSDVQFTVKMLIQICTLIIFFGVIRFIGFLVELDVLLSGPILLYTGIFKKMVYLCIFGCMIIGLWTAYGCQYIQQFLDEED